MAKAKDVVAVKKTTTVSLHVGIHGSSTIVRSEGLPMIGDRTDKAVEWLAAQGFKPNDIELVGEKPANWDAVFEIAPPVENDVPVVKPVTEITSTAVDQNIGTQ